MSSFSEYLSSSYNLQHAFSYKTSCVRHAIACYTHFHRDYIITLPAEGYNAPAALSPYTSHFRLQTPPLAPYKEILLLLPSRETPTTYYRITWGIGRRHVRSCNDRCRNHHRSVDFRSSATGVRLTLSRCIIH